jgi:hypothetical protein
MRAFLIQLVAVVWVTLAFAQAQTTPTEPLMGSEAFPGVAETQSETPDAVYRILVIGDGLAGGLGAGLTRMTLDDPQFEIINRFNESSGLSRPEVYDWPSAISKILSDRPVDAVVVLVGVNDRQDIRVSNFRYPFRSVDWVKGYEANVNRLLDVAGSLSARVFWVSIPPMADQGFDGDMRYLSEIHARLVTAKGGQFVDVRPSFLAADGRYIDKGPDETGVVRKLRSRDGIGFFKQGNDRFGQLVLAEIEKGKVVPAPAAVTSNVATAKTTIPANAVAPAVTGTPSFGQDGLDGTQITFRADQVQAATPVAAVERKDAASVASPKIFLAAKPGTAAQRLFTSGDSVAAPAGRFDDYAAPAQP